jgi:hypothetical protein
VPAYDPPLASGRDVFRHVSAYVPLLAPNRDVFRHVSAYVPSRHHPAALADWAWARAFHSVGFDAVLAALRFSQGLDRGLALFGDSGVPDPPWPVATPPTPVATPPTPVADVAEALGIPVVDAPDRDQLTFSEPPQPADA